MKLSEAAARCREDLWFLTTEVLYPQDRHMYGPFHKELCRSLPIGGAFRQLHLYPRSHFKTTILTIAHAIQQILIDPGASLLVLSGKDEHALLMSDEIRRHFVFNERMRVLFQPWCATSEDAMGSKREWVSPAKAFFGKKRREPTITATGFKSRLESKHYKGGYLDDCMGEDDASEAGLADVRENYKKVIPLIDEDGFVMVAGTRKHYNDLYQAMMDTGVYKVFVRHGLEHPTKMCDTDECARYAAPHRAPDFKIGVPLEPSRMDRAGYERKLRECEIDPRLGQSYFWHEYMNIPFSPTDRKYQPRWFVKVDDEMIPGQGAPWSPLTKWIAIDTALKEEEHPTGYDYNVVVVGGFDHQGRLYILDIFRDKDWTAKNLSDCVVTCLRSAEYGRINGVITEKVGSMGFNDFVRDCGRRAGRPVNPITITRGGRGSKSKTERILACQGYFEQGLVYFRKGCENYDDAVNEFCNLGRWTNDDIADAISMFFDEQVKTLAPVRQSAADTWKSPIRPMPFEEPWRRATLMGRRPENINDPLGRYGALGPAVSREPLKGF